MGNSLGHIDSLSAPGTVRRAPALGTAAARTVLLTAFLVGLAGDALLHDGPLGTAFALWIAVLALNLGSLLRRADSPPTREAAVWLATAVLFALGTAWRNDDPLLGFDVLATGFSLGMAAVSLSRPHAGLLASRLRETILTYARVVGSVAVGTLPLVFREGHIEDAFAQRGTRARIIRPILVAAALLLVFGALLRGADPIFASFVTLPSIDVEVALSHVVLTGFLAWITAGWARACLVPQTEPIPTRAANFRLAPRDAFTALATLDVLFAAFVLAQLGWLFGGGAYLQARTGLTVADYARRGFFQMVWVVALVIPILIVTRTTLPNERGVRRRHTAFALPLIALLGAIMISAVLRLKLYVHYYGLTTDRFYALVFMGWLAIVVAWLAVTVLRDFGRPFAGGAVASGLAALAILNAVDPDAIVARVNVDRVANLGPASANMPTLDLRHLGTLSGGAVPIAVREVRRPSRLPAGSQARVAEDAQRCDAARELLRRWGPESTLARRADTVGAWRSWNAGDANALRMVSMNAGALRAVAHAACVGDQR